MVIQFSFFASEERSRVAAGSQGKGAAVGCGWGAQELLPPCVGTVMGGCWEGRAGATGPPPAPALTGLLRENLPERLPHPQSQTGSCPGGLGAVELLPRQAAAGQREHLKGDFVPRPLVT